jgi:hypothetical protein
MQAKTKRTYNLSARTVAMVRELAARPELSASQDRIVEMAVERLDREVRAREETLAWGRAGEDAEFRTEMRELAAAYDDSEAWPA